MPCFFSAAKPIGTSSKLSPSDSSRSTSRSTCSVAAMISGPMPSPGMTTRCVRLDMVQAPVVAGRTDHCPVSESIARLVAIGERLRFLGLTARAPARMPTAMIAVIAACQWPAAARPAVAAQAIDENASAKVATRDEVWRRRKCLRRAWVRNQSWISVADTADTPMPAAATSASRGEASAIASDERREDQRDAAGHRLDLGAHDEARRDRRGGHQVGRVLAGDGEPGEAAGELARRHHQHRHQQHEVVAVGGRSAATASAPAAAGREAASASARRARDRGAAASIPCAAARPSATRRRKPLRAGAAARPRRRCRPRRWRARRSAPRKSRSPRRAANAPARAPRRAR